MLSIKDLRVNEGQIPGLPKNPRLIRDKRFAQLKQSIAEFPEMLKYREVLVFEWEKKFVVVAGNMRFLACKELGHKQIPARVLPADFPIDKLRELVIKDNIAFGDDDLDVLANEWTEFPLEEWGVELPELEDFTPNLEPTADVRKITADDIIRTKKELDEQHAGSRHDYVEVICPSCAETFYLNTK